MKECNWPQCIKSNNNGYYVMVIPFLLGYRFSSSSLSGTETKRLAGWKEWTRDENPPTDQWYYMNDRLISESKPDFPSVSLLRLRRRGGLNCPNLCFWVRFQSILQRALICKLTHLLSIIWLTNPFYCNGWLRSQIFWQFRDDEEREFGISALDSAFAVIRGVCNDN